MRPERRWLDLLARDASVDEFAAFGTNDDSAESAQLLATALEIKAQLQERTRRARELSALNDIAVQLATLQRPEDLLPEVVAQARRLLDVDLAYLGLVEDDPEPSLRIAVTDGALTRHLTDLRVPLARSLAGQVLETRRPAWVSDYASSDAFDHHGAAVSAIEAERIRGLLGVPLIVRDRVIGALFASKRSERRFTDHEVVLLTALAAHAAVAIDNTAATAAIAATTAELRTRTTELEQTVDWSKRLTHVVLQGGDVTDLLGEIATVATVPVRFLGASRLPSEVESALNAEETVELSLDDHQVLARPVVAATRMFGALLLDAVDALPRDRMLLEQAAPVLGLAFLAQDAVAEAGRYAREAILIELLNGPVTDATGRRIAERAGMDPSDTHTVIVIDASGPAVRELVLSWDWPRGAQLVEHQGRLVVITPETDHARVHEIWDPERELLAGVGEPVASVTDLSQEYRNALNVVRTLRAVGAARGIRTASELGPFQVLLAEAGRVRIESAFELRLGKLVAEGEERGLPLLETLARYLDTGQRPGAAAHALGIHVNTLYQRLALIDRILGSDWRSPAAALELNLLITLMNAIVELRGSAPEQN
ncbi:helix-turn-helix domain-containing protein [Agromyces aerolatus]|uniref:helix-turn-helix domain-containing protein n=1 Tax=Agromyces sp. LY-1074 TaxID=3074080 RepID=UPI0028582313|nr:MULTISPECIES: GAF domain-containing protein [unclassified Agromyces]MDR5700457.1 GAF domain-containing protein [Agromyces sp. LY-1074]MDR5706978.1 GAF domain-containing protein [Agromyces sp. LY-1358]